MNLLKLAMRNIAGSSYRSWVVVVCAGLLAGFGVAATIVIGGAQDSLRLAMERLGADIIVVPAGSEARMENAFLMGAPAAMWMPRSVAEEIAAMAGVEAVSPQMFLSTLKGATCCSVPEMFLIAYEPETDFTLKPWLIEHLPEGLDLAEAVGGNYVYLPSGDEYILIYGYPIDLVGKLERTGTGLDQSMFFTFETAMEIARMSPFQAVESLDIPAGSISAAMVRVSPGADPGMVTRQIRDTITGVTPIESSNLFRTHRTQMVALMRSVAVLMGLTWAMSIALIGLVFSMAMNERQREIGVLRALGAARPTVLKTILGEGVLLALLGGVAGIILFTFTVYLFKYLIVNTLGVPFLFPAPLELGALSLGGLALALASVILAALVPALRISVMDPAVAMRE